MAIRRIRQLGDPILRETSAAVRHPAGGGETLEDLRDTLHEFQRTHGFGRGISAIQIGVAERLIYIEFEGCEYCIANPVYEFQSEQTFRLWDDCFSFPDLLVYLERAETVRVRYEDEDGVTRTVTATGPLSELLQHEIDHLDGVLAVDRALDGNSLATREEWRRIVGQQV
ncbi:MAG: formylmethionine deformylase [Bryobacterales bacterium]|nr:formylmethionine deformylase [Bryobacterales bacterium]